jgi:hypothetical protein
MLYTPHFLVGAAIMKYVPNPAVGLPLSLASHILLDLTPHNDFDIKQGAILKEFLGPGNKRKKLIIGALLFDCFLTAASFVWVFLNFKNYLMLTGGIVAVLPDVIEQALMIFGIALPGWQDKFQWRVSAKYGFISYPVVSLIAIYLLLK